MFLMVLLSILVAVEGIQFEYEPETCKNEEKRLKTKVTVSAKDDSLTIEDLYQNCNYFVKVNIILFFCHPFHVHCLFNQQQFLLLHKIHFCGR